MALSFFLQCRRFLFVFTGILLAFTTLPSGVHAGKIPRELAALLQPTDGILVTEEPHRVLFSKNADVVGPPASILKIATAFFALDAFDEGYRFPTDAAIDEEGILFLKGFGDPLLTSEVLDGYARTVAQELRARGIKKIAGIGVDGSHFDSIVIPGVNNGSSQPYDAPNGALCANFNTVAYQLTAQGKIVSAEPQTPMIPFISGKISNVNKIGRIHLTPRESRLYAGHLFGWFLNGYGVTFVGSVRPLPYPPTIARRYERRLLSPFTMAQAIEKLMMYSNNFMANQIYLAAGAVVEGAPANLAKSRRAFCKLMIETFGDCPEVVEGSGISRRNGISPRAMDALLLQFSPQSKLLRSEAGGRFKTGTLSNVSTRAGYLASPSGKKYRVVIMTHRKGGDAGAILETLRSVLP